MYWVEKCPELWMPRTSECELIWNRVFTDAISQAKVRSCWNKMSPNPVMSLYEELYSHIDTQRGEDRVKTQKHTGTTRDNGCRDWSYAFTGHGTPRIAGTHWKKLEGSFLRAFRESRVTPTSWFWTCNLQNHERTGNCCSKSPGLWHFVGVALGNRCWGPPAGSRLSAAPSPCPPLRLFAELFSIWTEFLFLRSLPSTSLALLCI